ncbi:hypothetical protein OSCT_3067 [Oscillochloris trichoides DG-6]|uniref:Uncharacterized protein n=1 Tax=Oscillochloris trichoides DG-6 TaxID=765420 RepID=E1IIB6_9CHLR|nr:hypothetical protein [Oscillochloris trichoides]EFO79066.1 hypothetical protein OSCT_3067 [Oscillochloris trichoides DG-6]
MNQLLTMTPLTSETTAQLLTLLELRRHELPFADEELSRHQTLLSAIEEQNQRGEQTLADWRKALAQRWQAEVAGQRAYIAVQRKLATYFDNDTTYLQLVAPTSPAAALTATTLLADMRRLEASLTLLRPRPPFAEECLIQMREAGDQLAAAITMTEYCEAERRRVLIEQRMATHLYERVCQKTRQLVAEYAHEEELAA